MAGVVAVDVGRAGGRCPVAAEGGTLAQIFDVKDRCEILADDFDAARDVAGRDPDPALEVLRFCRFGQFGHEPGGEDPAVLAIERLDLGDVCAGDREEGRRNIACCADTGTKIGVVSFCWFGFGFTLNCEMRNSTLLPGVAKTSSPFRADGELLTKHGGLKHDLARETGLRRSGSPPSCWRAGDRRPQPVRSRASRHGSGFLCRPSSTPREVGKFFR